MRKASLHFQDGVENSKPFELPVCFQCQKLESCGKVDWARCETKRQKINRTYRIIRDKEHFFGKFE